MAEPRLSVKGLSVRLEGRAILQDVSLALQAGEVVSVVGPNGAGKSTFVKCLAGIITGWEGEIFLAGQPFRSFPARERARRVSYVPQAEGRDIPLTVEEFVALGRYPYLSPFSGYVLSRRDREAVERALERAGLTALKGRVMNTLSGGERQMAFIAAALAQESGVLLLDEPTAFLDYGHQVRVNRLLRETARREGTAVLAVHHDLNQAVFASDRIAALREGRLLADAPPEVFLRSDLPERLYGVPFLRLPVPGADRFAVLPDMEEKKEEKE